MRNIAFLAVGALLVGSAFAGDKVDSKAAEAGRALFSRHCASCHGVDGKGGGPVAGSLKAPVPDLTKLAFQDGRFDDSRIRTSIDGTQASTAHGTREMPVWGKVLASTGVKRGEAWAQAEVWTILEYVKSIQATP